MIKDKMIVEYRLLLADSNVEEDTVNETCGT